MAIFKVSAFENIINFCKIALKMYMFFGTSILNGFGDGLGRVLRVQNPRFFHFFVLFFEA